MRKRRIFVTGRQFPDSMGKNVVVTLRAMGHTVETESEPRGFWRESRYFNAARDLATHASRRVRTLLGLPLRRAVKRFRPDLVLSLTRTMDPTQCGILREQYRGPMVVWFADPIANVTRDEIISSPYDLVFYKDRDAVTRLAAILGNRFRYLPEAANPMWHRPVPPAARYRCDIGIAGNSYPYRYSVLERLGGSYNIKIWGDRPAAWLASPALKYHTGEYVFEHTKAVAFSSATTCLNTLSLKEANSANCRCFEVAGCGGFQIMEYRPIVAEYFEPGKEILLYRSIDELRAHLERGTRDQHYNKRLREAAARRVLAEHTYEHRLQQLLDACA